MKHERARGVDSAGWPCVRHGATRAARLRSSRLQGCAPPQAGIRAQESARRIPACEQRGARLRSSRLQGSARAASAGSERRNPLGGFVLANKGSPAAKHPASGMCPAAGGNPSAGIRSADSCSRTRKRRCARPVARTGATRLPLPQTRCNHPFDRLLSLVSGMPPSMGVPHRSRYRILRSRERTAQRSIAWTRSTASARSSAPSMRTVTPPRSTISVLPASQPRSSRTVPSGSST